MLRESTNPSSIFHFNASKPTDHESAPYRDNEFYTTNHISLTNPIPKK